MRANRVAVGWPRTIGQFSIRGDLRIRGTAPGCAHGRAERAGEGKVPVMESHAEMETLATYERNARRAGGRVRPEDGASGGALLPVYLRETGATPLLTKKGEVELARELQESRKACSRLFRQLPRECREQVLNGDAAGPRQGYRWSLEGLDRSFERLETFVRENRSPRTAELYGRIRREKRRVDRARDALILANLRLVTHIVKKYAKQGVPFLDLIQEGNIGLMRAVEKFEYEKGYKFSTYAYWWIKQAITRAIADKARLIRIPVHVGDKLKRIQRIAGSLAESLGRNPTPREIARKMGLPVGKVKELMGIVPDPQSLDSFGPEGELPGALCFVADSKAADPLDRALEGELERKMRATLGVLDDREKKIIRLRFGIGHDEPHTLEEIGRKVKLSRERVRQIENLALKKIRDVQVTHELGNEFVEN
jgi:RNA polymerase sigma factor (sigma-70 family)